MTEIAIISPAVTYPKLVSHKIEASLLSDKLEKRKVISLPMTIPLIKAGIKQAKRRCLHIDMRMHDINVAKVPKSISMAVKPAVTE